MRLSYAYTQVSSLIVSLCVGHRESYTALPVRLVRLRALLSRRSVSSPRSRTSRSDIGRKMRTTGRSLVVIKASAKRLSQSPYVFVGQSLSDGNVRARACFDGEMVIKSVGSHSEGVFVIVYMSQSQVIPNSECVECVFDVISGACVCCECDEELITRHNERFDILAMLEILCWRNVLLCIAVDLHLQSIHIQVLTCRMISCFGNTKTTRNKRVLLQ